MLKNMVSPGRKAGGFFLGSAIVLLNTPITNILRERGFITEGFNPHRDVYERTYGVGPFKVTRDVLTFTGSTKGKIVSERSGPFIIEHPSGVRRTFKSKADLARRLSKLVAQAVTSKYPDAPLLVYDKGKNHRWFIPTTHVRGVHVMTASSGVGRRWSDPLDAHKINRDPRRKARPIAPDARTVLDRVAA